LQEHKLQRHSYQAKTLLVGWGRKAVLVEYNPMRLDVELATVDEGAVEVEDNELH
jgi:hypothetical protein